MSAVKREKIIKIRVTEDEHQALKQRCPKAQLAEWMREHCLGVETSRSRKPQSYEAVDPALLRQLAGIGNNLNQIARRINRGDWKALDKAAVISVLIQIERELSDIKALYR
ncbi:TPA: MobC family plasmid mobilization relaxosome protein [Salmonella enterica subsp. enterica serovar Derby]|uniref:MobC family plasmid mobilization relaxosome protein n=1 Tax=Klebsiella pneumoniae TaxID=573 RepID=UPI00265AACC3|nr:MobC family plasmid mobilization relaxosome protein [Klebsiella pneumoniae]HBL4129954.1 MobC family plasmid mobilization relaxosome protein [Salmonella enterica subsp. enterica serovar Derby]